MTPRACSTVAVALIATVLFFALVFKVLSDPWIGNDSGSVPTAVSSGSESVPVSTPLTKPKIGRTDVAEQVSAMREMHRRMSAARSPEARVALMPESDRLMQEGLVLMRSLKPGLPAKDSGELISGGKDTGGAITQAQAESVQEFLGLMEMLIEMKGDRDSVTEHERNRVLEPGQGQGAGARLTWLNTEIHGLGLDFA